MTEAPATKMPVMFIGHGNPMNAIRDTAFTRTLRELGQSCPQPKAILCVSAHWMTEGSWVTGMAQPRTIYDFYGFPPELYAVQYPAPGDPATAKLIQQKIREPALHLDTDSWGIDHGSWSILRHMFPAANIPVLQLSLDMTQPSAYHFHLGKELRRLRSEGVLIIGSGNIVHNLRLVNFDDDAPTFEWAIEFDAWVKKQIQDRDFAPLVHAATQTEAGRLSIPTPDHWYPLLYVLGAAEDSDSLTMDYEGFENASLSMRCLSFRA